MAQPIRRGQVAIAPEHLQAAFRAKLLDRYVADAKFAASLGEHYQAHVEPAPELPRWRTLASQVTFGWSMGPMWPGDGDDPAVAALYVAAVRDFVMRWGLDRFLAPPKDFGAVLVHEWCRTRRKEGPTYSPAWIVSRAGLGLASYRQRIGEAVDRAEMDIGVARVVATLVRPAVRIAFTDEWNPARESRGAARERLRSRAAKEIQGELTRIQEDAESKGYLFPGSTRNLERDLDWLFAMMTRRATPAQLAARAGRDPIDQEAGVAKALRRIAEHARVSVRGWRLPRE